MISFRILSLCAILLVLTGATMANAAAPDDIISTVPADLLLLMIGIVGVLIGHRGSRRTRR